MTPTTLPLPVTGVDSRRDTQSVGEAPASRGIGSLVLQLARRRVNPDSFPARRTRAAVTSLPDPVEARLARRVVDCFTGVERNLPRGLTALVAWAGYLETRGKLEAADRILKVAVELSPLDPELSLHAARVARKAGNYNRAQGLYDDVERLDDGTGRFALLGRVGHAMISPDAHRELGLVLREALQAGETEVAAVAQEARGLERAARGDRAGGIRDLLFAAVRFGDPADMGRIGHRVADLLISSGLPTVARRVLDETAQAALPDQARWARARLYDLARLSGDEVGCRRWKADRRADLVSLSPSRGRPGVGGQAFTCEVGPGGILATTVDGLLDRLQRSRDATG